MKEDGEIRTEEVMRCAQSCRFDVGSASSFTTSFSPLATTFSVVFPPSYIKIYVNDSSCLFNNFN
ncbi:MAG: hypothetical protein II576_00385, partial [Prevotella sp.]|nr:hypothetical protein [Prevotella sp.]